MYSLASFVLIFLFLFDIINGKTNSDGLSYCDPGMYCESDQNNGNSRCIGCPTGKSKSFNSAVACHSWGLDKSTCEPVSE